MIKPGYRTSEFWFTLVSFLFSGAFLLGIISDNSQKEDLIAETSRGLEALILIIGQLAVLFRYIKGRNEIKKIWWSNNSNNEDKVKTKETTNVKQRVNKTRSRKTNTKHKRKG
jgi:tRNA G10  N-methylase Trm11